MALIPCKQCGKNISSTAKKCPHCQFQIEINISQSQNSNVLPSKIKITNFIEQKKIQYNFIYWTFLPDIGIYVNNNKVGKLKINESIEILANKSASIYTKPECNYSIELSPIDWTHRIHKFSFFLKLS